MPDPDPQEPTKVATPTTSPVATTNAPSNELVTLRAQLAATEKERARLALREGEIMKLLDCQSADHLLHDLRNVLNERTLYRTLADMADDQPKDQ